MRTLSELKRLGSVRFMGFEWGGGPDSGRGMRGLAGGKGWLAAHRLCLKASEEHIGAGDGSCEGRFSSAGRTGASPCRKGKVSECAAGQHAHEVLGGRGMRMSGPKHFGQ